MATKAKKPRVAQKPHRTSSAKKAKSPTHRARTRAPAKTAPPAVPVGAPKLWKPQGKEVGIRVRMYRVGFGDFFLVSFLADGSDPLHMVIDCGVFKGKTSKGDLGSLDAAVADMVQTTGGKLALLIVTHRHADHIAGFARCADAFRQLAVQAIWMSAWESEYSPTAVKFQTELTRAATILQSHFAALGADASEEQEDARQYMENATGLTAAGGKGPNAAALNLLKHGFKGVAPEYYAAGATAKLPPAAAQAGITAQILGPPPVADVDLMKLMDLKKGVGQYLAGNASPLTDAAAPFNVDWEVFRAGSRNGEAGYSSESFREWLKDQKARRKVDSKIPPQTAHEAKRQMESSLGVTQSAAALVAAKQLNSFLNNQSLVVLFTFKGKKLLFVGDAQAGNWEHWLSDTDTPDKSASAAVNAQAQKILTSLNFYKVGHHGSANATPKAVVALMGKRGQKLAAMCSTQADVYGKEDVANPVDGTEVPRLPLLAALRSATELVRSDQVAVTVDGKSVKPDAPSPLPTPSSAGRFEAGALWIDCFL